jgi:hypothetical protein
VTTAREVRAAPRYESHHELSSHWHWRPEWSVDRPCLLWYLTFENQPSLWRMVERLQERLRDTEALDPVPPPWLHLTMEDVAFADEIAPNQIEELVDSAASAIDGWAAPPLTLGPVAPLGTALVLEAGPESPLRELRDRLRAGTSVALGPGKVRGPQHFRPHVSFAYINAPSDRGRLLEPVGDLVSERVVVAVPRLTLAAVTRRNRHYQWIARATLDLAVNAPVGQSAG